MSVIHGVKKLKGVVQNYSWGGFNYVSELLGQAAAGNKPIAEYWLGAHPNHSSVLENEGALADLIKRDPEVYLGSGVARCFSSLPYLFKVLDVRQMLSIQVHPGKVSAAAGFEEENKKGIPVNAPHRNYKDTNHKPELMVALGDFWLLHGFKEKAAMDKILDLVPEISFLKEVFNKNGYKGLYESVMLMEQEKVDKVLGKLVQRIVPLYKNKELDKESEDFWAARAADTFCQDGHFDRGIFSVYFFNLLHLKNGEGIFQPQGMPHAYLEGQNVEVMANSDNVLRAGLTDKHIDVPELMKHVHFEATRPSILRPEGTLHKIFSSPAEEFELHQYQFKSGEAVEVEAGTGEVWFLLKGILQISGSNGPITVKKGEALFVLPGTKASLAAKGEALLFRVTVPPCEKN